MKTTEDESKLEAMLNTLKLQNICATVRSERQRILGRVPMRIEVLRRQAEPQADDVAQVGGEGEAGPIATNRKFAVLKMNESEEGPGRDEYEKNIKIVLKHIEMIDAIQR